MDCWAKVALGFGTYKPHRSASDGDMFCKTLYTYLPHRNSLSNVRNQTKTIFVRMNAVVHLWSGHHNNFIWMKIWQLCVFWSSSSPQWLPCVRRTSRLSGWLICGHMISSSHNFEIIVLRARWWKSASLFSSKTTAPSHLMHGRRIYTLRVSNPSMDSWARILNQNKSSNAPSGSIVWSNWTARDRPPENPQIDTWRYWILGAACECYLNKFVEVSRQSTLNSKPLKTWSNSAGIDFGFSSNRTSIAAAMPGDLPCFIQNRKRK